MGNTCKVTTRRPALACLRMLLRLATRETQARCVISHQWWSTSGRATLASCCRVAAHPGSPAFAQGRPCGSATAAARAAPLPGPGAAAAAAAAGDAPVAAIGGGTAPGASCQAWGGPVCRAYLHLLRATDDTAELSVTGWCQLITKKGIFCRHRDPQTGWAAYGMHRCQVAAALSVRHVCGKAHLRA